MEEGKTNIETFYINYISANITATYQKLKTVIIPIIH